MSTWLRKVLLLTDDPTGLWETGYIRHKEVGNLNSSGSCFSGLEIRCCNCFNGSRTIGRNPNISQLNEPSGLSALTTIKNLVSRRLRNMST